MSLWVFPELFIATSRPLSLQIPKTPNFEAHSSSPGGSHVPSFFKDFSTLITILSNSTTPETICSYFNMQHPVSFPAWDLCFSSLSFKVLSSTLLSHPLPLSCLTGFLNRHFGQNTSTMCRNIALNAEHLASLAPAH